MRYRAKLAIPCCCSNPFAHLASATSFGTHDLLFSFYTGWQRSAFTLGLLGARSCLNVTGKTASPSVCKPLFQLGLLGLRFTERAYGPGRPDREPSRSSQSIRRFATGGHHGMEFVGTAAPSGTASARNGGAGRMFHNPLVLGIIAGFAVNLSGLAISRRDDDALSLISFGPALPAALFALGGRADPITVRKGDTRPSRWSVSCPNVHPAIVWMMGSSFGLPKTCSASGVLTAADGTGFNAYNLRQYVWRARRVAGKASVLVAGQLGSAWTAGLWLSVAAMMPVLYSFRAALMPSARD